MRDPFGDGDLVRIGNVPERRLLIGVREWVLDGLRVAFEYSHLWDYPTDPNGLAGSGKTGTGRQSNAFFTALTYEW